MTRDEALKLAEELHEYRAVSMVAGGRALAIWFFEREKRLAVLLAHAVAGANADAPQEELAAMIKQIDAEVHA